MCVNYSNISLSKGSMYDCILRGESPKQRRKPCYAVLQDTASGNTISERAMARLCRFRYQFLTIRGSVVGMGKASPIDG